MRKRILVAAAAAFMLFGLAQAAFCGLVITDLDGSTTYVSGGKIRNVPSDQYEQESIFDFTNGIIIVLNPEERTAARGTLDEYCETIRRIGQASMEMMKQFSEDMGDMPGGAQQPVSVKIEKADPGGSIAGYETVKYKVFADGNLYEEVWLSKDKHMLAEVGDPGKLARFESCSSQMMGPYTVESDQEYQALMTSGWVLKSVSYEYGGPETTLEVTNIEEKRIPADEFEVPAGYRTVPLSQVMTME